MATDYSKTTLPSDLLPAETRPGVAAALTFLEGPAVDAEGTVFFSDIMGNRIMKLAVDGQVSVFRADSGRTNGNTFDAQGRLISCEGAEFGKGGRRRMVRTDMKTGEVTVLTERYQGKRYNSPNDVVVDTKGRIWFTDPLYSPDKSGLELDAEAVYRLDPDGKVTRILSQPEIQKPNGLAITPDDKTLYVVDSSPVVGGNRKIWAFDVSTEGAPSNQRLVHDFGPGRGGDGMRLDMKGNLWIAAGVLSPRGPYETGLVPTGIHIVTPAGQWLGRIPIFEDSITNLAFGGPDHKTLYMTAGRTLYRIRVNVSGYALYPPLQT